MTTLIKASTVVLAVVLLCIAPGCKRKSPEQVEREKELEKAAEADKEAIAEIPPAPDIDSMSDMLDVDKE